MNTFTAAATIKADWGSAISVKLSGVCFPFIMPQLSLFWLNTYREVRQNSFWAYYDVVALSKDWLVRWGSERGCWLVFEKLCKPKMILLVYSGSRRLESGSSRYVLQGGLLSPFENTKVSLSIPTDWQKVIFSNLWRPRASSLSLHTNSSLGCQPPKIKPFLLITCTVSSELIHLGKSRLTYVTF
jgi:hypothetical protein